MDTLLSGGFGFCLLVPALCRSFPGIASFSLSILNVLTRVFVFTGASINASLAADFLF